MVPVLWPRWLRAVYRHGAGLTRIDSAYCVMRFFIADNKRR
jgi:hypothetical protein